jgi:hypothetical protein
MSDHWQARKGGQGGAAAPPCRLSQNRYGEDYQELLFSSIYADTEREGGPAVPRYPLPFATPSPKTKTTNNPEGKRT